MANAPNEFEVQQLAAKERFVAAEKQRQSKTRAAGVKIAIVGALLNAVNVFMVVTRGHYFVLTTLLGPAMMLLGIWLAAVGQPIDPRTGRAAKWGIFGMAGAVALGAALSIAAFVVLNSE